MRIAVSGVALVLGAASRASAQPPEVTAMNANGTWQVGVDALDENGQQASGRRAARFQVSPGGALSGVRTMKGMGDGGPADLAGTVDGDQIGFRLVSTRAESPAGRQSLCAFEGTIQGVRLSGSFSDPHGRQGQWEGWWSAAYLKARSAAAQR
ncbi:MAG: hypothetical protein HY699_18025 [Deltaproteobacteria bacterium]|nr:hypothetical protein [Deltaproteobacteria bacterium]